MPELVSPEVGTGRRRVHTGLAYLIAGGLYFFSPAALVVIGWFADFDDAISHRVHEVSFGALFAMALVGVVTAAGRRGQRAAGEIQALVVIVSIAVVISLSTGFELPVLLYVVPIVVLVALDPDWRSVVGPRISFDGRLLAVVSAPMLLMLLDAGEQFAKAQERVQGHESHWGAMAAFDAAVVVLLALVVLRIPGWRVSAWTVGVALGLRASVSLGFPFDASAFDTTQSILILLWLVLFVIAVRVASGAPPFERHLERAVVAGVAAGLAAKTGRRALWFRAAFVIIAPVGAFLYVLLWIVIPRSQEPTPAVQTADPASRPAMVWWRTAGLGLAAASLPILAGPGPVAILLGVLLGTLVVFLSVMLRRKPIVGLRRKLAMTLVVVGSLPVALIGLVGWTGDFAVPVVPHQVDSVQSQYCTSCHRNPGVARGTPIIDLEMVSRGECVMCHRHEPVDMSAAGSIESWRLPLHGPEGAP